VDGSRRSPTPAGASIAVLPKRLFLLPAPIDGTASPAQAHGSLMSKTGPQPSAGPQAQGSTPPAPQLQLMVEELQPKPQPVPPPPVPSPPPMAEELQPELQPVPPPQAPLLSPVVEGLQPKPQPVPPLRAPSPPAATPHTMTLEGLHNLSKVKRGVRGDSKPYASRIKLDIKLMKGSNCTYQLVCPFPCHANHMITW
jgi:hypothetical protein